MHAVSADVVVLDKAEHFQKMSYRNRYRISGSNNPILLTVPLENGRDQRTAMGDVEIHNDAQWQQQHWRTLVSVYNRSPYFGHYEPGLKTLFERDFHLLTDFNKAALLWVSGQIKVKFEIKETDRYIKNYPEGFVDIRQAKYPADAVPVYYQVFEDRVGFQPDLSILDLLFSEGPATAAVLSKPI